MANKKRTNTSGTVYTPSMLGDWVAREMFRRLPKTGPVTVIDPACGDGQLLASAQRVRSSGLKLAGFDIDGQALARATKHLPVGTRLATKDSLKALTKGWSAFAGGSTPAAIICNPPWGASLPIPSPELRAMGYTLATGQYDSFDLFMELSIRVAPLGTVLAFIVPDSVFLPEHAPLRRLLLSQTELRLVARLGEGFFANVYRGTAVIIAVKKAPRPGAKIECMRLKKATRDSVLEGLLSLAQAKTTNTHTISQKRFAADSEAKFDIDVTSDDLSYFGRIKAQRWNWTDFLESGRGVELSKAGVIWTCRKCGHARPEPRGTAASIACEQCGRALDAHSARREQIVSDRCNAAPGWKEFIVGEDVDRYTCAPSRMIRVDIPGINYKDPATFEGPKLLFRKTGVGLKAAIDSSSAFTNQVVFHYRPRPESAPAFFLDYLLGVLCSRVMLAYHLKHNGEVEWRSHPYVTQKVIADLPVPNFDASERTRRQAAAIARAVVDRRSASHKSIDGDLYIESLVAGLFGLDEAGCAWVSAVIADAQQLQGIREMRISPGQLTPRYV